MTRQEMFDGRNGLRALAQPGAFGPEIDALLAVPAPAETDCLAHREERLRLQRLLEALPTPHFHGVPWPTWKAITSARARACALVLYPTWEERGGAWGTSTHGCAGCTPA